MSSPIRRKQSARDGGFGFAPSSTQRALHGGRADILTAPVMLCEDKQRSGAKPSSDFCENSSLIFKCLGAPALVPPRTTRPWRTHLRSPNPNTSTLATTAEALGRIDDAAPPATPVSDARAKLRRICGAARTAAPAALSAEAVRKLYDFDRVRGRGLCACGSRDAFCRHYPNREREQPMAGGAAASHSQLPDLDAK